MDLPLRLHRPLRNSTIGAAGVALVKQESWESWLNLQQMSKVDQVPRMVVEITGRCKMVKQVQTVHAV